MRNEGEMPAYHATSGIGGIVERRASAEITNSVRSGCAALLRDGKASYKSIFGRRLIGGIVAARLNLEQIPSRSA